MIFDVNIDNDILFNLSGNTHYYSLEQFSRPTGDNSPVSLCHVNIRSLYKNIDKLKFLLNSLKFSFIAFSECWVKSISHSYFYLPGYELIVNSKQGPKAGGGVALYTSLVN